jgi:hypothetical protein
MIGANTWNLAKPISIDGNVADSKSSRQLVHV